MFTWLELGGVYKGLNGRSVQLNNCSVVASAGITMDRLGHLEFGSAPDPQRIMAMVNTLPDNVREKVMENATRAFQNDPVSQTSIRKHWETSKETYLYKDRDGVSEFTKSTRGKHSVSITQSWDVKQDSSSSFRTGMTMSSALRSLTPIQISDLKVGQTHRGRILLGSIADTDGFWIISSVSFLLQDLSESVVEVAVYNSPRSKFSNTFSCGRHVCIVEPFFKIRGDGSAGIRVDNPDEIIDFPFPRTSEEWKELGNSYIKQSPEMALTCYEYVSCIPLTPILLMLLETFMFSKLFNFRRYKLQTII